jgi:hypothetical protein
MVAPDLWRRSPRSQLNSLLGIRNSAGRFGAYEQPSDADSSAASADSKADLVDMIPPFGEVNSARDSLSAA